MARAKWSGRIDQLLVDIIKGEAADNERSEAFYVESALREMFSDKLPDGWKPGKVVSDDG